MPRCAVALAVAVTWAAWAASGCAYRFAAVGELPGGIRRVRAPIFANSTAEPGMEALFAGALRQELARAGVEADAGAEAELLGEVLGVWGGPTILTTPTPTQPAVLASYRIFASARLRLLRGGQPLAQADVVGSEDFLPGADILLTESNRQAALHRLSERLMREGFDRLMVRRRGATSPSPAASSGG